MLNAHDHHQDSFLGLGIIKGTEGEEYLNSRRITTLPRKGVRFSGLEFEPETMRNMSSLFSIMTTDRMKIAYTHKTFLVAGQKAPGINAKKIFTADGLARVKCDSCGHDNGESVAVRLFDAGRTLGIAEGLETALSATQIYETPTWMLGNATYLKNFTAPKSVRHLIIYADNDKSGTGLMAAFTCGHKNIIKNGGVDKVTIRCPEDVEDFNDMLFTQSLVRDWVLYRK